MRRTLQGRPHQPRAVPSRPHPGKRPAVQRWLDLWGLGACAHVDWSVLAGARSQPMPSLLSGALTRAAGQATQPCATLVRRLGSERAFMSPIRLRKRAPFS